MEKLSEIPWGIPNNKWIKHKFEHQIDVAQMAQQEIVLNSRNMVGSLKFCIEHLGFWHN